MTKLCRFTVEGAGEFPLDMLRYDACHPEQETDSYKIYGGALHVDREIQMVGYRAPSPRRWASFGWKVLP